MTIVITARPPNQVYLPNFGIFPLFAEKSGNSGAASKHAHLPRLPYHHIVSHRASMLHFLPNHQAAKDRPTDIIVPECRGCLTMVRRGHHATAHRPRWMACQRPDGPVFDTGDRGDLLTVCDMWRAGSGGVWEEE